MAVGDPEVLAPEDIDRKKGTAGVTGDSETLAHLNLNRTASEVGEQEMIRRMGQGTLVEHAGDIAPDQQAAGMRKREQIAVGNATETQPQPKTTTQANRLLDEAYHCHHRLTLSLSPKARSPRNLRRSPISGTLVTLLQPRTRSRKPTVLLLR